MRELARWKAICVDPEVYAALAAGADALEVMLGRRVSMNDAVRRRLRLRLTGDGRGRGRQERRRSSK